MILIDTINKVQRANLWKINDSEEKIINETEAKIPVLKRDLFLYLKLSWVNNNNSQMLGHTKESFRASFFLEEVGAGFPVKGNKTGPSPIFHQFLICKLCFQRDR